MAQRGPRELVRVPFAEENGQLEEDTEYWPDETGYPTLVELMRAVYAHGDQWRHDFGPPGRPSSGDIATLFSFQVYHGGALVLYALRQKIGKRAFEQLERELVRRYRDDVDPHRRLHRARVEGRAARPLRVPATWLYGETTPPMPGHPDWTVDPVEEGVTARALARSPARRPELQVASRLVRVLILSWEYPPIVEGGLARHVRKLSEQLVALGVEVHVVTRGGGRLSASEDRHGVAVHRVREPDFPKHDLDAFIAWVEHMNADMLAAALELDGAFDLVHSHDWLVADAARELARRFAVPWLVTVHATEYGRHQGWVDKHPQSHIHAVEQRMVREADRVITCSAYMRGHVADVFGVAPGR